MTKQKIKAEIISVDVETFGDIPGHNSMKQIGAVAYDTKGNVLDIFHVNLTEIPNSVRNPDTMAFWAEEKNQTAFKALSIDLKSPKQGMTLFRRWCQRFTSYRFMAYNMAYDSAFIRCYAAEFAPFQNKWLQWSELRDYMMGKTGCSWSKTGKRYWPDEYLTDFTTNGIDMPKGLDVKHSGIFDALQQGHVYFKLKAMK